MRLVLHPKVYSDINEIMGYYERVATPGLAEEFYTELRYFMTKAADKPKSFMADDENSDFAANDAEQKVIWEPPQIRSPDITLPD